MRSFPEDSGIIESGRSESMEKFEFIIHHANGIAQRAKKTRFFKFAMFIYGFSPFRTASHGGWNLRLLLSSSSRKALRCWSLGPALLWELPNLCKGMLLLFVQHLYRSRNHYEEADSSATKVKLGWKNGNVCRWVTIRILAEKLTNGKRMVGVSIHTRAQMRPGLEILHYLLFERET